MTISREDFIAQAQDARQLLIGQIFYLAEKLQNSPQNMFCNAGQLQETFTDFMMAAAEVVQNQIIELELPRYNKKMRGDIAFYQRISERFNFTPTLEEILKAQQPRALDKTPGMRKAIEELETIKPNYYEHNSIRKQPTGNQIYYFCSAVIHTFVQTTLEQLLVQQPTMDAENIISNIRKDAITRVIEGAAACRAPVSMPGVR